LHYDLCGLLVSGATKVLIFLEWDGVLTDVIAGYHRAHQSAAAKVGWSALDAVRFRAALRKQGMEAQVLPGAPPLKVKQYREAFTAALESNEVVSATTPLESVPIALRAMTRHAALVWVSLGTNAPARQEVIQRSTIAALFKSGTAIDPDPRKRPAQLRTIAGGEKRVVVAAASEPLIRAAGSAEMIAAGLTTGPTSSARLQQAGADVVYGKLDELAATLNRGAPDLVQAGLLPLPLGH